MIYDTEMPPWREMGLFTELVEEHLHMKFKEDPENHWLQCQKRMLEDGVTFIFSDVPTITFRDYLKTLSDYEVQNDDRWHRPALVSWANVAETMQTEEIGQGSTLTEQPVPTPAEASPEEVFTAEAAGVKEAPAPPTATVGTAANAPTPPPPPPAQAVPQPVQAQVEVEVDMEDGPPPPDMSTYEDTNNVYHAYEPIRRPTNVSNENVPLDEMVASMQAIYMRLSQTIFDKCEWNGAGQFGNPAGVLDGVSIADIPHAQTLIHSCESVNSLGQKTVIKCNGLVKGTVFVKKRLPAYVLYLNINGKVHKRTLVAQNPNTSSKSAKDAARGARITWIINGDLTDAQIIQLRAQGKRASKFIAMIKDNRYITLK
jgi:hypothetical protein